MGFRVPPPPAEQFSSRPCMAHKGVSRRRSSEPQISWHGIQSNPYDYYYCCYCCCRPYPRESRCPQHLTIMSRVDDVPQLRWGPFAFALVAGAILGLLSVLPLPPSSAMVLYQAVAPQPLRTARLSTRPLPLGPLGALHRTHAPAQPAPRSTGRSPGHTAPPAGGPSPALRRTGALWAVAAALMSVVALALPCVRKPSPSPRSPLMPLALAAATGSKTWGRREALAGAGLAAVTAANRPAGAAGEPEPSALVPESVSASDLQKVDKVRTASGLEYRDIVVGGGPRARKGQGVTFHMVGVLPEGRVFINTLDKGRPLDARIGTDSISPVGLEEGLSTMRVGGVRRIYCPAELAYQMIPTVGVYGTYGTPQRPPAPVGIPVIFDVQLLLVPGVDEDEDEDEGEFQFSF